MMEKAPKDYRELLHGELDRTLNDAPQYGAIFFSVSFADGVPVKVDRNITKALRLRGERKNEP